MIEVSIAHDKELNRMSDFAQLLYLKVLPHTDDWGRFEGDPEVLKGRVDPLSKRPVAKYEAAMKEIAEAGLWLWYQTDKGKMVLQFNQDSFERINAFLIKSRKNQEYPPHKDSYQLICGVMAPITHIEIKAISKEQRVKSKEQKELIPPSVEEVITYFVENGFPETLARRAFEGYSVADWHDSHGTKVKNWKQKMNNVWFKEENRHVGNNPNQFGGGRSPAVSPNKVIPPKGKYDGVETIIDTSGK